jgi:hypothetical protein
MPTNIKNAYLAQVAATDTTLVTSDTNAVSRVITCTATNDTTTTVTISFHKVESGGSVGDDRLILNAKVLGSRETYECPEVVGQVLDAGDYISAIASAASQVTVSLDIAEIT